MKVLNVNMSIDPITGGGTAERTFQISRALLKEGIECSILTLDIGLTSDRIRELNGIEIIALPCINKRYYIPLISYNIIKKAVKNSDIVHIMGHWTFINIIVYTMVKKLNKPYVVCPAGALPIYGRSRFIKYIYNFFFGKKIINNANGHIAITSNEKMQFQDYGVRKKCVYIIPNGVNPEDYQEKDIDDFRKNYGLGDNPFILFIGRLNFIKGPDLLLRAFCNVKDKLSNYNLVFAGPDGGMLSELKYIVNEFSVSDRVKFLGYLGGVNKSQIYHAADLLVIPSRQEAMSIVVLEAGVTGTPVLLTDQCGFDEMLSIDGGALVSATVRGISNGLIAELKNRGRLEEMGENLKKFILNNFTWDSVIQKYLKLYAELLHEN